MLHGYILIAIVICEVANRTSSSVVYIYKQAGVSDHIVHSPLMKMTLGV